MLTAPSTPRPRRVAAWVAAAAALVVLALALAGPAPALRSQRFAAARSTHGGSGTLQARDAAGIRRSQPAGAAAALEQSGTIRSSAGGPLAGARVCERATGGACAHSDGSGRFHVRLTRRGRHTLEVSAPGHCSTSFELGAREEASALALVLRAGGSSVSGWLEDASGGPIQGGEIRAVDSAGLEASSTTNVAGAFSVCVAPGPLRLVANADGYAPRSTLVAAPAERVQLTLLPAARIAGQVLAAATGDGVPGAKVAVFDPSNGDEVVASTASAAGGAFELVGIPPGRYELGAAAPSWRGARQSVTLGLGEALDGVRVEVEPATTLRVTLELDGEPCRSGSVGVSGPVASVAPVSSGSADFDGLPPGRYLANYNCATPGAALAGPDGEALVGGEEFVELGQAPLTRSFALSSPTAPNHRGPVARGSIDVAIRASDGALEAFGVALYRDGQRLPHSGERRRTGVFFDGLGLGEYDLYLEQAPFVHQRVALRSDGERADVVLTAPQATTIAGSVLDADGYPAIDAKVRAFHRDYPSHELAPAGALVLTDQDGSFRITGLFAGRYRVSAAGEDANGELDDVAGGSDGVVVRLEPPAAR